jgi:hypothetical protein
VFFFIDCPTLSLPLKRVAEIFGKENLWQLINAAVSGEKNLKSQKDLVRVYKVNNLGASGHLLLQVSFKNV